MKSKRAYSWLAVMVIMMAGLVWMLASGPSGLIETNVMALLPKDRQHPVALAAMDRVTGELERKVVFLIEATDEDLAVTAADNFFQGLETLDLFASVSGRVDADQQKAWSELYFSKRFQMLTEEQRTRLKLEPEKQVQIVQQQLYSPFAGVTGAELKNDPFLLFRDYLSNLAASVGSFILIDGFPGKRGDSKIFILITAETADSAYGLKQLDGLFWLEEQVRDKYGVEIHHTGVLFYAAEGIESGQREISTIGIGSLIGVLVLLVVVYRSPLPVALALLSIGCGLLAAFVVTVSLFGKIHLFSLVFGASLIGISIDYAFHYLTHRMAAGSNWNPVAGLKAIFSAITIGLITSLMGYAGLLAAPFPGLQQLAVFSTLGLTGAYATVVCWYPVLAAKPGSRSGLPMVEKFERWLRIWKKPIVRIGVPVLLVVLSVPGILSARFEDDIRQLQALPPELRAQEETIQQVIGSFRGQEMLLVTGASEQEVLERLHDVGQTLENFQSLENFLPSESVQRENYELVKKLYATQGDKLGLAEPPVFSVAFEPLTVADFLASRASGPFRFLWLGELQNGRWGSVILLNSTQVFAEQDGVHYLNKTSEISELFGEYRIRISWLLSIASLAIWILLVIRYGLDKGTRMVLPPVIAGIFSISLAGLSGEAMNIFNLLALAIVLGIGIDYTLFFAEHRNDEEAGLLSTLLAISLSAATTILSFGLLALSATRAIQSFGITVLIGIYVSWLLAPLAMSVEKN